MLAGVGDEPTPCRTRQPGSLHCSYDSPSPLSHWSRFAAYHTYLKHGTFHLHSSLLDHILTWPVQATYSYWTDLVPFCVDHSDSRNDDSLSNCILFPYSLPVGRHCRNLYQLSREKRPITDTRSVNVYQKNWIPEAAILERAWLQLQQPIQQQSSFPTECYKDMNEPKNTQKYTIFSLCEVQQYVK